MKKQLKISEIYWGDEDAKNLFSDQDPSETGSKLKSFLLLPFNSEISSLKKKIYIRGDKGSGKTALLRLLQCEYEANGSYTRLLQFRSGIRPDEREDLYKSAKTGVYDSDAKTEIKSEEDAVPIWKWFIYKIVCDICSREKINIASDSTKFSNFCDIVNGPIVQENKNGIRRLLPKIKNGVVEFDSSTKVSISLDWEDKDKTKIRLSKLVAMCDQCIRDFNPGEHNIVILLDELEISPANRSRDICLLAGLLIAVDQLSSLFKESRIKVKLHACVRNEVVNDLAAKGQELNKTLADHGLRISWESTDYTPAGNQLIAMLGRYIHASVNPDQDVEFNSSEIIGQYVIDDRRFGKSILEYMINLTWYRPRELVRLMRAISDCSPTIYAITNESISKAKLKYAKDCWDEICESMAFKYKPEQMKGVRKTLKLIPTSIKITEDSFCQTIQEYRLKDPDINSLHRLDIKKLFADLYDFGVIGNETGKGFRFKFRGNDDADFTKPFVVHTGLDRYIHDD